MLKRVLQSRTPRSPLPPFVQTNSDAAHIEKLSQVQQMALAAVKAKSSYAAAARDLEWPLNTLKTRVHRARALVLKLRAAAEQTVT